MMVLFVCAAPNLIILNDDIVVFNSTRLFACKENRGRVQETRSKSGAQSEITLRASGSNGGGGGCLL